MTRARAKVKSARLSSAPRPILAVADLHGHLDLFDAAVERGRELAGRADVVVVTLGDYCDNGPDVPGLIDTLIEFGQDHPGLFMPIIGNHDLACLLSLSHPLGPEAQATWWARWRTRYPNGLDAWMPTQYGARTLGQFRRAIPRAHLAFLKGLPWCRRVDDYVFVHSGLARGPIAPQLAVLDARDVSGYEVGHLPPALRDRTLSTTFDKDWDATVISGHAKHARGQDFIAPRRIGLHSASCQGESLHAVLLGGPSGDPVFFEVGP